MKKTKHKITFRDDADARAVALASLGMSNTLIMGETGLTSCQVTYRLHKAKELTKARHGYRVSWRSGESTVAARVIGDWELILKREIQRSIPILISHPPMEASK